MVAPGVSGLILGASTPVENKVWCRDSRIFCVSSLVREILHWDAHDRKVVTNGKLRISFWRGSARWALRPQE